MVELNRDFVVRYAAATPDEKVYLADQLTGGQRMLLGAMMFDYQCELRKLVISMRKPWLNEVQLAEERCAQLDIERECDDCGTIGYFIVP
ncbi:hypothetical protein BH09PLA1_BH09PLA1_03910 [soil metagenome]